MANSLSWTSANGVTLNLDDGVKYKVLLGKQNFLAPPISMIEDKVPQAIGSVLRWVNVEPRVIDIPLIVYGTDYTDMIANLRALGTALDPTLGSGHLTFTLPSGEERILYCIYNGGFEGNESDDTSFVVWSKFLLSFKAHDPYFYGSSSEIFDSTYYLATGDPFLSYSGNPSFFPLRISQSAEFTGGVINNASSVEVYPTWIITGPANYVILTNNTSSKSLSLNHVLQSGETVTINTKLIEREVTSTVDGNIYGKVSGSFWPLLSGDNDFSVNIGGYDAGTSVRVIFPTAYTTL